MTGFFVFIGFLLIVGIITIYGWVQTGRERVLNTPTKGRKVSRGRFDLLVRALDNEGFFKHQSGQTERRLLVNDYLSSIISDLSILESFFGCVVSNGLTIENNPDKTPGAYPYLLCSDYACIGFTDRRGRL
jgi:hypothetical protein